MAIPKSGASARPPYENAAAIMATLLLVESFKVRSALAECVGVN